MQLSSVASDLHFDFFSFQDYASFFFFFIDMFCLSKMVMINASTKDQHEIYSET
jgi:hypothetical protein